MSQAKGKEEQNLMALAMKIVAGSIGILLFISASVIAVNVAYGKPDAVADISRMVFSAILPLVGTWVGTVLAYYFSKDNFSRPRTAAFRAWSTS